MNNQYHHSMIFVVLLGVCLPGCASLANNKDPSKQSKSFLDRFSFFGEKKSEEPEPYPHPVKMAVTWTPDTLIQSGRTPTRGFGGRVFFYDEKSRPVPVAGSLVIHGFDDASNDVKRHLKRFEFTPDQFTNHFSQTDLGASYSIWIPWDAVGGDQVRISLVASFRPTQGAVLQGTSATILLPGKNSSTNQNSLSSFSTQYQHYKEATANAKPSSGLTTTTIARRSRNRSSSLPEQPKMNLPGPALWAESGTEAIAKASRLKGPTPMMDLHIAKPSSSVLPASAQLPRQR